MALLLNDGDPAELTFTARGVPFPNGMFHRWLPAVLRRDHRFRFFRSDKALRRAAPVRAWDTPAVPIPRGNVEEVTGRMVPISDIAWLLEEESQLLDAARASGDPEQVTEVFGNDVVNGARSVLQRIMIMQGEAVALGRITIGTQAAPENGLQLPPVDFGYAADHDLVAATLFDVAGVDILGQLQDWVQTYVSGNGQTVRPGVLAVPQAVANLFYKDEQVRGAYATAFGTPASVGLAQVNELLGNRDLPRLEINEHAVPDWNGVPRRELPANRVVLLPDDPAIGGAAIGQTQWGITEEAKKIARAEGVPDFTDQDTPGMVAVPMESENPVQTGTLVAGIVMPVVTNPELVLTARVLA